VFKKVAPNCLVVTHSGPAGNQPKRRTVNPKMGAPYQLELHPGRPTLLIGDDEISAVQKDLASPTMQTLALTPEQAQRILGDLCEKAAADEISKLRQRVATLETRLESVSREPIEA
jgi:hypothetical protein